MAETAKMPIAQPLWRRYVCCFLAIIALILAGYVAVEDATQPLPLIDKEYEPGTKRFDHVTFTNATGETIQLEAIRCLDEVGQPCFTVNMIPRPVEPGRTVTYYFPEDPSFYVVEVEVEVSDPANPGDKMTEHVTVPAATHQIISAKFWLGIETPGPGPGPRRLFGEAMLSRHTDGGMEVVPLGAYVE